MPDKEQTISSLMDTLMYFRSMLEGADSTYDTDFYVQCADAISDAISLLVPIDKTQEVKQND